MNANNSTQDNQRSLWPPRLLMDVEVTLWSILLVWSIIGNVLIIAVVYCNQNLRTNMNYLIVNMAVSDLLIPLVQVPWWISWTVTGGVWLVDGPLGEALCRLMVLTSELSPFVSSITLVIIAFQRFMAVVYPNRGQVLSRKRRWITISFPWVVSTVLHYPRAHFSFLINIYGNTYCVYSWAPKFDPFTAELIYHAAEIALGFVVPLIITIIMYSLIVHNLRKSLNSVRNLIERATIRLRQRRNRRIFTMLMSIVVLFTICWCPLLVCSTLSLLAPTLLPKGIYFRYMFVLWYLWYFQTAVNPCIYFVFLKGFRQGLKRLCCRTTAAFEPMPTRPRTPGGYSNQGTTCTPTHTTTTSL